MLPMLSNGCRRGRVVRLPGLLYGALAFLALQLGGCSTLPRNALPAELSTQAAIPGMPIIRANGGERSPYMMADLSRSFSQESAEDFPVDADGIIHYPHID